MPIGLAGFLLTIILSVLPLYVSSQQIETQISADTITVKSGEILQAEGNVIIQYGDNTIKAKSLMFNQKTNELQIDEVKEFYDGKAIRFSADKAELDRELSEGVISAANLILDETIKIRAGEVRLKDGEISSAQGISRVTSCEVCEHKEPNWHLTASSADRDVENLNIVYRNVTVRVKGFPVAYIPYLRMPDPSVSRARGFLVPEAALTSNLATGIKLPYFIPLGSSRDLLITPYVSSKTKTLEYRYRQKFIRGDLMVKGAFSSDDLIPKKLRYFSQALGSLKLGYGVNLNFDVGKVGDTSYLGDYAYSEESELEAEITLDKTIVGKQQFLEGELSYFREKDQGSSLDEYYSLSGSYVRNISPQSIPGKLRLSANLNSALNVNDDNSFSRPPSSAQLAAGYSLENFLGPAHISTQVFGDFNSFVNSADAGTTNEEFSFKYGASSSISSPLIKKGYKKVTIINPKISLALNGQENDILGDYFIGADELTWGNIFSGKKITSLTESDKKVSVSAGLEGEVLWDNGHFMNISFAAAKLGGLTYTPNTNTGLTNRKVNYLGKFVFQTNTADEVAVNASFSSNGKLLKSDLRGTYTYEKVRLVGNYEMIDQAFDSRLSEDLKTLEFLSSYDLIDRFNVSAGGRYDLTKNQMAKTSLSLDFSSRSWQYQLSQEFLKQEREKFALSAIYDDGCTRLTFSFENRYQDLGASEPVKSLMFRVQLKPFANVVFSQGSDQLTF